MIHHFFNLRSDVRIRFDLPEDLTKAEATALIDRLEALLGQPEHERRAAIEFMTAEPGEPPADDTLPLPGDEPEGGTR